MQKGRELTGCPKVKCRADGGRTKLKALEDNTGDRSTCTEMPFDILHMTIMHAESP
jgi:hypothetical protein